MHSAKSPLFKTTRDEDMEFEEGTNLSPIKEEITLEDISRANISID